MPGPVLLSSGQAADALGIGDRTVHRWVKSGRIKPAGEVAGAYVFTAEEVARVAQLPKLKRGRKRRPPQNTQLPKAGS